MGTYAAGIARFVENFGPETRRAVVEAALANREEDLRRKFRGRPGLEARVAHDLTLRELRSLL